MTGQPIADSVSLERSLVKYLQASRLIAVRELIPMKRIACDSSRADAHKGHISRTKSSSKGRFRGSQIVYTAVWLWKD